MNYKKTLCTALSLFLLTGCQSETANNEDINNDTQFCTIKWCLTECGFTPNAVNSLNEALRDEGCQYKIQIVEIPIESERSYAEQVHEYEELYGTLDIVSSGYEYVSKSGEAYEFITSGYFTELEDISAFDMIPEKLWESVRSEGKIYTVPNLGLLYSGAAFYFNKEYISQEQIDSFDGDLSKLSDMVKGLSLTEDFLPVNYDILYYEHCNSFPYSEKGGLFLDNISHKAVNPYEYEPFVNYARNLNLLYDNGLLLDKISLSSINFEFDEVPENFAVKVTSYTLNEEALNEQYGDMEIEVYSLPYYLEKRVVGTTGVAANSEHKEYALDFLKRLYSDTKYSDIILNAAPKISPFNIGMPEENIKSDFENVYLSDFIYFEIMQKDIDAELQDMLVSSFDRLCKSEDFDQTLEDINNELKAAGIDGYIDNVNKLLEENFAE